MTARAEDARQVADDARRRLATVRAAVTEQADRAEAALAAVRAVLVRAAAPAGGRGGAR